MRVVDPEAAQLARVRWLIGLRWLAAAGLVVGPAVAREVLGFPIRVAPLQIIGAIVAAYNVLFRLWLRRIYKTGAALAPSLRFCTNAQIALDLIALALTVHFTGGIESPLAFFFVFHMMIGSMVVSLRAAYAQATLASGLYGATIALEAMGYIAHYPLGLATWPTAHSLIAAWPIPATVVFTLYVSVYIASTIAGDLRRREAQLVAMGEELAQRAGVCEVAYSQLQSTQERELAYMRRVSHELKSPLSAISMMLRVVLDSLIASDPAKQREMIERAEARAKAALELTQDLLTLSHLREPPAVEETSDVSISHLIDNVIAEEELNAQQQGVSFVIDVEDGLSLVRGDAEALMTLLRNLVSNAVKYSPDGGEVALSAKSGPDCVILTVADQGIGIAEEDIPRIFDDFYRTAASRRSGIGGTGLGLPIVKSIVDRHKGEVTVEGELGRGTSFRVRLPIARREASE
jgi:signal transduction histidine kinase